MITLKGKKKKSKKTVVKTGKALKRQHEGKKTLPEREESRKLLPSRIFEARTHSE